MTITKPEHFPKRLRRGLEVFRTVTVSTQTLDSIMRCHRGRKIVYNTHHMNSTEVIRRLKADGWVLHHVRGSHHQFKHPDKPGKVTVPHPKKDLPTPTLRSIFRQAGWPWRDQ